MARIVVVGEAMLDVDLVGGAARLSPEAPVPVLDDIVERSRPGGAALAAAMAARDGHEVTLLSPLGDDDAGRRLSELLGDVEVIGLPQDGTTPVKRRVRSGGQSLVRLDSGGRAAAWSGPVPGAHETLRAADVFLVSDYGRGLTHETRLREMLRDSDVPLVWDPHTRGADPVDGTTLYTPTADELHARAGHGSADDAPSAFGRAMREAVELLDELPVVAVAATLGPRGAVLTDGDGPPRMFAADATAGDPCGAGDRFASAAALVLALGGSLDECVDAAVASATAHVAAGGAAAFLDDADASPSAPTGISAAAVVADVRRRGGTVVATGGCFDLVHAGHVAMLESARRLGDCLVVCLNSDDSVRRLKGPQRPLVTAADRARVLRSLSCVDAVEVFDEDTPSPVIERLRPDVWVKGGDYAGRELPEERVLRAWGGQAVLVPYLEGRSTTGLVRAMSVRTAG